MAIGKDAVSKMKKTQQEVEEQSQTAAEMVKQENNEKEASRKRDNETRRKQKRADEGFKQIAVYVDEKVFQGIKDLSHARAIIDDTREDASIQGCINLALRNYVKSCEDELNEIRTNMTRISQKYPK